MLSVTFSSEISMKLSNSGLQKPLKLTENLRNSDVSK